MADDREPIGLDKVLADVKRERQRQVVVEGFKRAGDDAQPAGRLALMAAAYLVNWQAFVKALSGTDLAPQQVTEALENLTPPEFWPVSVEWWKPHNDRDDLVRAAALVVAEIEKFDRAAQPTCAPCDTNALEDCPHGTTRAFCEVCTP